MQRILCSLIIVLTILLSGCSLMKADIPGYGQVEAESNYNIKIYTDVDYKLETDGSIIIDDTTIFYIKALESEIPDMDQIRQIFDSRYEVYKKALK